MSTTILPVRSGGMPAVEPLPAVRPVSGATASQSTFPLGDLLKAGIASVEGATQNANAVAQRFLSGDGEDLHTVAIAEQKAEITSDLFLQLRNKAVSAYQEIMRMQL